MQLFVNWIPTEKNPADAPSRRFKFDSTLGFPGEGPSFFLYHEKVQPVTRGMYRKALDRFIVWARGEGESPQDWDDLDQLFVEYCEFVYLVKGGGCRSYGVQAFYGIYLFMPQAKGYLPLSLGSLKGGEDGSLGSPPPAFLGPHCVRCGSHGCAGSLVVRCCHFARF